MSAHLKKDATKPTQNSLLKQQRSSSGDVLFDPLEQFICKLKIDRAFILMPLLTGKRAIFFLDGYPFQISVSYSKELATVFL